MIVSGIDRYIESWFKILKLTKVNLPMLNYHFDDCGGGDIVYYAPVFYVYNVSNSGRTVKVTFVTDSSLVPGNFASAKFFGIFGQPTVCVNSYQAVSLDIPYALFQLIVVFSV